MSNMLVNRFGRGKVALALPLLGLIALWKCVLIGQYWEMLVNYGPGYDPMKGTAGQNAFHPAMYLFLLGVAALGVTAVIARRMAHNLVNTRLEKAVNRFSLVAVIVSLLVGTIFGFAIFMGNFMTSSFGGKPAPEMVRIVNVYVPILLDAAILVFVILKAFVSKVQVDEDDEAAKHD